MESTPISKEDAKKRLSEDGFIDLDDSTTAKDLSDMYDKDWPWHEEDGMKFIKKQIVKDTLAMEVGEDLLQKRVMVHCLRQHAYPGHILCYEPGGPEVGLVSLQMHLWPAGSIALYRHHAHLHKLPAKRGIRSIPEVRGEDYDNAGCYEVKKTFDTGGKVLMDSRAGFEVIAGYVLVVKIVKEDQARKWPKMPLHQKLEKMVHDMESGTFKMNFVYIDPSKPRDSAAEGGGKTERVDSL